MSTLDAHVRALLSGSSRAQLQAIESLTDEGSAEAWSSLKDALPRLSGEPALAAARALVNNGTAEAAIEGLSKALTSSEYRTREWAVKALREIGGEQTIGALSAGLKARRNGYGEADSGYLEIIDALYDIGGPQVIEPLSELLISRNVQVQRKAVFALTLVGGTEAMNAIAKALPDMSYDQGSEAVTFLNSQGYAEAAIDGLSKVLASSEYSTPEWAVKALREIGGEQTIGALCAGLRANKPRISFDHIDSGYLAIIDALGDIGGPRVIEPLSDLLISRSEEVQRKAVSALTLVGGEEAMNAIAKALPRMSGDPGSQAVTLLRSQGYADAAIDGLSKVLASSEYSTPEWAVKALREIGGEPTIGALCAGLRAPKIDRYWKADSGYLEIIDALGDIGGPQVIKTLSNLLITRSEEVQRKAVSALTLVGGEEAMNAIVKALPRMSGDPGSQVVTLLSSQGYADAAIHGLSKVLASSEYRTPEWAVKALREIGGEQTIRALSAGLRAIKIDRYRKADSAYLEIIDALGKVGGPQIIKTLSNLLIISPDVQVRIRAMLALVGVGGEQIIEPVSAALTNSEPEVRSAAAGILGRVGVRKALPLLKARLRPFSGETNPEVRLAIQAAIAAIETASASLSGRPIAADPESPISTGRPRITLEAPSSSGLPRSDVS